MLPASLLDHTRSRFPNFAPEDIAVTPLEKGGSDRKFYRIVVDAEGGDRSLILVKYNDQREENRHYVDVAHFLADRGINVPQIIHHDAAEGLIWMQDLGEIDLWAYREEAWETRREKYAKTVEQAARLHALGLVCDLPLQPGFDERLYLWEQNYFIENCLGRHYQCPNRLRENQTLQNIAKRLSELPQVLVHRDFQSQNVMIRDDEAWLIDFQGMRPGLRQYDLASLLYDPYVDLTDGERDDLLTTYQSIANIQDSAFLKVFHLCALQRLMQALGAYGFLGYERGKPEFLRHIPKALTSLREVAQKIDGLDELTKILTSL